MEAEGSLGDCFDYLEVFDGTSSENEPISFGGHDQICGFSVPETGPRKSSGSTVTIVFVSDDSTNAKGFRLTYKSVPSSRKRRNVDSIVSRNEVFEPRKNSNSGFFTNQSSGKMTQKTEIGIQNERYKRTASSDGRSNDDASEPGYVSEEDYEENYANSAESSNFYNLSGYFALWKASELPDYSDFREVVIFPQDIIRSIGYQKNDFIVQCTYDGRECSSEYFKTFQDPYFGNCFSFNSIRGRSMSKPIHIRKSSKTGQEFGLKLTLFVNAKEYVGVFGQDIGAKLALHDPFLEGRVRTEGASIPVGETTFLGVQQNVVSRLGGNYGDCTNEWPEFLQLDNSFKKKWPRYCFFKVS